MGTSRRAAIRHGLLTAAGLVGLRAAGPVVGMPAAQAAAAASTLTSSPTASALRTPPPSARPPAAPGAGKAAAGEFYKVLLKEVIITSFVDSGASAEDAPTESVSLAFGAIKVDFTPQTASGAAGQTASGGWGRTQNREFKGYRPSAGRYDGPPWPSWRLTT